MKKEKVLGVNIMGYASGTRWSDELIRKKVLEVVDYLKIDRMPSSKECVDYFHNSCLSSAISRKCGWRSLAYEMNLPMKKSETNFGKSFEKTAEIFLSSIGFEVKAMPQNFPYDILVSGCIKVDVKASKLYRGPHGSFYSFNLEKPFATCDIYILYLVNDDGTVKNVMVVPSKFVSTNTQISVGGWTSKYDRFIQRWDFFSAFSAFMEKVV